MRNVANVDTITMKLIVFIQNFFHTSRQHLIILSYFVVDDATVQQDNERFHQLNNRKWRNFIFFIDWTKLCWEIFTNSGSIDNTCNKTLTLTIKKLTLNDLMRLNAHNCIDIDLDNSPSKEMQSNLSDSITSQSSQSDESDWTLHVSTTSEEDDDRSKQPCGVIEGEFFLFIELHLWR